MSQSQSKVPLFAPGASYGFSELCDKYKEKGASIEVGRTKIETKVNWFQ